MFGGTASDHFVDSAPLLRRRTAFLLRGIRVGGAWGAGETEQLSAGGDF